ncbi:MAG: LuxR C-terminal-related transcriptional regulator [Thiogranum sp.]|nr:LuxR C-terminal-related transcriptional regulator [Thiogranum sp.]
MMVTPYPAAQADADPIEVLLVDDRQLARAGLQRVLLDSGYLTVSGEASSCDDAIRLARKQAPRIILINLPGATVAVLDGASKLHRQLPDVPLLVLTEETDLIIQERLLQSGVAGCVSSYCAVDELFKAIDTVMNGARYISDSLARKLAERRLPGHADSPFDDLSHRELQILLMVAEGKAATAIARHLCLTQKTVNGYRNRLMDKLQARTEVELMHLAARHGLIRLPRYT